MRTATLLFLVSVFPLLLHAQQFALYTLSLSTANAVNIFSGNSTGYLAYSGQILTGGGGAPAGGPGLQSQHSLYVRDNYLFAVNPTSNTLSVFGINPTNPTLITLLGTPQNTGGTWPLSVTAYNGVACVVNSGDVNGFRCFTYGLSGLAVIAGSDQFFNLSLTNPPATHTGPAQISFTPDGTGVVISNKLAAPPLYYYLLTNGTATANTTSSNEGKVSFGFEFDTDGDLILTDAAPTGAGSGVIVVHLSQSPLSVQFVTPSFYPIDAQLASCWVSRSPQTGHFYVANAGSNNITDLSRNDGFFTTYSNYPVFSTPTDNWVATIHGVDYLFQIASQTQEIYVFSLSSGGVTWIQTIPTQNTNLGGGVAVYVVPTPPTTTTTTTTTTTSGTIGWMVQLCNSLLVVVVLSIFCIL